MHRHSFPVLKEQKPAKTHVVPPMHIARPDSLKRQSDIESDVDPWHTDSNRDLLKPEVIVKPLVEHRMLLCGIPLTKRALNYLCIPMCVLFMGLVTATVLFAMYVNMRQ